MPIASCNSTTTNISAVTALKTISYYLPNNDAAQNLTIIQREARIHNVQAHSLALLYHGRARTIAHTARTLIFAFKLGVDWLQVWWAQVKKSSISPPYTPLVDGGQRTNDNLHRLEIRVPETPASVARLLTVDDISTPSYSSRPRATTTTIHALEIYQPASSTEPSSCCSGPQLITLFSICVITLFLIITASSTPQKPKLNPTSNTTHPVRAKTDEEPEYPARPSLTTTQSPDSDTEDTDGGGGTRLPSPTGESSLPVPRNRPVHAHHEVGEVASFSSRLRGGRRNVNVHWYREHAREVRRDELREKRKRMANGDWRVSAGD